MLLIPKVDLLLIRIDGFHVVLLECILLVGELGGDCFFEDGLPGLGVRDSLGASPFAHRFVELERVELHLVDGLFLEDGESSPGHPVVGQQLAKPHLLLELVHRIRVSNDYSINTLT